MTNSFFGKIAAVIVTYHPDENCIDNFRNTLSQVDFLIIVDNNSDGIMQEKLKSFAEENQDSVFLIINAENIGLSKSQNIGIKRALEQKADWVMLLDDDSKPTTKMLANMHAAYVKQTDASHIAMIVPHLKEMATERVTHYIAEAKGMFFKRIHFTTEESFFVACAIASGSLIKADILREHGLMNEDFFIDYIDTEYCLRLTSLGYRILAVNHAQLEHTLGAQTRHGKVLATNHSPARRYTIYRNRTITWKTYWRKAPHYIIYDIMASMFDIGRILAFESQKWPKIRNACKGVMHGLFSSRAKRQKC